MPAPAKKAAAKKAPAKKAPAKKAAATGMKAARDRFAAQFDKSHGEGLLDRSGEIVAYEVISTGCLSLDEALGVGGWVEGRLNEIWGVDAIGKTTLAIQALREAQKKHPDKLVAVIDMEHTFDKKWAALHGVNIDSDHLWLVRPDSAEQVADIMKDCLRSGLFSIIVLDSIGAMIPEAEKEKDADQATMAIQAKIVTRMVKIAAVEADNTSTVVLFLNQVRANLSYGADTTTGGGFALKHVTTHKLKLSRGGREPFKVKIAGQEKPVEVGHEVAVLVERNKVAPPKRRAQFVLFHTPTAKYGPAGIDKVDDAVTVGIRADVIHQRGGYYDLPTGETVQGREAVVEALRGNYTLIEMIREGCLQRLKDQVVVGEEANPLADPEAVEALANIEGLEVAGSSIFGNSMGGEGD